MYLQLLPLFSPKISSPHSHLSPNPLLKPPLRLWESTSNPSLSGSWYPHQTPPSLRLWGSTSNPSLSQVVGIHIKPYAVDIINIIIDLWGKVASPTTTMMVVDKLIIALGGEFKTYIAQLIPLIMKVR